MREFVDKLKSRSAVMAALCVTVVLAGCGSAAEMSAFDAVSTVSTKNEAGGAEYYNEEYQVASVSSMSDAPAAEYANGSAESPDQAQVADTSRKLVKNVSMNVETKEFDGLLETVQNQVKELGGYIENMDVYNGSAYSTYRSARNASLTIRIPQSGLETFLNSVSDIGNVTDRSDSVEDITLTYVDTESRREALAIEQERLMSFLDRAESIEDIITIESRLSEVRYQLESIESKLRTYDNQVDYGTVCMYISEVKELTPVEEKSTWQRMADGFMGSIKSIGRDIRDFAVWFVIHIPYFVIWGIVILVFILILRAIKRRTKRIKEKEKENE